MNKKFWYLTKVSLKKKIGSKWFIATNIILALVILAIININSIVKFFGGDFSENLTIYAVDNAGVYDVFKGTIEALDEDKLLEVKLGESSKEELSKNLKDNEVIVILNEDDKEYLKSEIISNETIDNGLYQIIISSLNSSKSTLGMIKSNISPEILANISSPVTVERTILSDQGSVDENMTIVMNSVFPTLILPFFMLITLVVQMVGAEINEEKSELNFQNEDSTEQKELADQDLIVAEQLVIDSEKSDDTQIKKACDRKAIQTAQEAVEKYQKSVVYADERHEMIANDKLHESLEKTHNTKFQQRETEKAGINILEAKDIDMLNNGITKKPKEKSPYNAIRFSKQQNITHENAKKNLEKKIEDQKHEKIYVGNLEITFDL